MITLKEADFTPLDEFALCWRFTDPRRNPLPLDALRHIRPLTSSRADQVALATRAQCSEEQRFGVTFRSDDRPDVVQARLRGLPPLPSDEILVSWNPEAAVACTWDVFVRYWDDFCYPSSDDVTVWPLHERWSLCYRHYEIFQFSSSLQAV